MRKILSIILGAFLCAQAFAQVASVSVNAGYLNSAYRLSDSGYSIKVSGNGFYAGIGFESNSDGNGPVSFAPGLNFNISTYNLGKGEYTTEYFLSAPLHIRYTQPVSNVSDLFISAGPTFLCTLGSKTKSGYGGVSVSQNEKGGSFDVSIGVEGGVLLSNSIKLMVGYDFGLLNQFQEQNQYNDYRITRNIFHAGVGYKF